MAAKRSLEFVATNEQSSAKRSKQEHIQSPLTPPNISSSLDVAKLDVAKLEDTSTSLTPQTIYSSSSGVDVEAVLTNLSPIKNKRFVADLIDETQSINLVGFDATIQSKLKALEDKKSSDIAEKR